VAVAAVDRVARTKEKDRQSPVFFVPEFTGEIIESVPIVDIKPEEIRLDLTPSVQIRYRVMW